MQTASPPGALDVRFHDDGRSLYLSLLSDATGYCRSDLFKLDDNVHTAHHCTADILQGVLLSSLFHHTKES